MSDSVLNSSSMVASRGGHRWLHWSERSVALRRNRRTNGEVEYKIESEVSSPATRVIFPTAPHRNTCLKLWVPCNNGLYSTEDISACTDYLLDGLAFNRQFASQVYRGIAQVLSVEDQKIYCGPIISHPEEGTLRKDVLYALVMNRLPADWRLDHQLSNGKVGIYGGMSFLAKSIAEIHKRLIPNGRVADVMRYTTEKLSLNKELFGKALHAQKADVEAYRRIGDLMEQARRQLTKLFELRVREEHVKRCHGDLKTANLWIRPERMGYFGFKKDAPQLLLLDCVDFNAKFCLIDTLSDVAMLAVDLEMRIDHASLRNVANHRGKAQALSFLKNYLDYAGEQDRDETWLLLEYYMTEKAMIYAYMNILYDKLPTLGRRYMEVALEHANNLEKRLEGRLPASLKRKTGPLLAHCRENHSG